MRTNQPEALRLADELEIGGFDFLTQLEAVAELRRLHALNAELLTMLVEAANFIQPYSTGQDLLERIDAAIAKATGGQA